MLDFKMDDKILSVDNLIKDANQRSQETSNGKEKNVAPDELTINKEK